MFKKFRSFITSFLVLFVCLLFTIKAVAEPKFVIIDDPELDAIIESVRIEYLEEQVNRNFTRLDCTLLLAEGNGVWRRGSYNGDALSYPASCVKLAYLASALNWERENNLPYDFLDDDLKPMIEVSDNFATGCIVDRITDAPNISDCTSKEDPRFKPWYENRLYTENFLESYGLLEGQTILHKTYPTNSGEEPTGAELVARDLRGGNRMTPKSSTSLMLEVISGFGWEEAIPYIRNLLKHDRLGEYSSIGFGIPPGCVYENKIGVAYDTVEDIAHIILPNGQEFILAIYTNSYDPSQPIPYDADRCGYFTEKLIERLNLCANCPPNVIVDDGDSNFYIEGSWLSGSSSRDKRGETYTYKTVGSGNSLAVWNLNVPEAGVYEVAVWYPQGSNRTKSAKYTVYHEAGEDIFTIDQRKTGGRFIVLGNFVFREGGGKIIVSDEKGVNDSESAVVVADAVKATKILTSNELQAQFSYEPAEPNDLTPITFIATATGGKPPYQFNWDICGSVENGEKVIKNLKAGSCTVTLTVTDSDDETASETKTLLVTPSIKITNVQWLINPNRLKILGEGFEPNCKVYINGNVAPQTVFKNPSKVIAKGNSLKKLVPKGVSVEIVVKNADGRESEPFYFKR